MVSNPLESGRLGRQPFSHELNEERLKFHTRSPPTSFQDILPPSLIAPPMSSNGSASPKTPHDSSKEKSAPARSRFAQLARKAAPKMKGVVDSLRSSKNREKQSKPDPVAVALLWAESASISKASLSDTLSSNLSYNYEFTHDPNLINQSHSIHSHSTTNSHQNKAQMSAYSASDSSGGPTELDRNREKTFRQSKKCAVIRTVRFKEEEEFIPTPLWTPSSSTWSLNGPEDNWSIIDDHDDLPWDDLVDTRPNGALALAAIERTSAHGLRGNSELRIIPPHLNVVSTVT